METFIAYNLNKAERELDSSKIITFGPYSIILSFILFVKLSKKLQV